MKKSAPCATIIPILEQNGTRCYYEQVKCTSKEAIMNKNIKLKKLNAIKVKPTGEYPCQWDDLIDSKNNVIATIYTLKEGRKDNLKSGVEKGTDGIYDIVVNSKEITAEVVKNAFADLEKITDKRYMLADTISSFRT